jgi:hypothetical protein
MNGNIYIYIYIYIYISLVAAPCLHPSCILSLFLQDKTRPAEFQKAEGLTIVPKESDTSVLPLDKFRQFFNPEHLFGSN